MSTMNTTKTTTTTTTKKKNPNKVKKSRTARENRNNARMLQTFLPVSHCGVHYAAALVDPFHAEHGACVPAELFPLPSQKVTIIHKGVFDLGTTGYGFVLLNPTVANNVSAGFTSSSTSVGGVGTLFNAYTNLVPFQITALPYSASSLVAPNLAARIVSVGLRARYSGQLMIRGGTAYAFEEPDHQPLDAMSYQAIAAHQQSWGCDVTNWTTDNSSEWSGLNWMANVCYSGPTRPQDIEFVNNTNPLSVGAANSTFMGICISGSPGDKWTFEVAIHIEYIGSIVPERTPSHADPMVFAKVLDASKTITAVKPLQPADTGSFLQKIADGIRDSVPMIQDGAKLVKAAVSMDIGGVLNAGASLLSRPGVRKVLTGNHPNSEMPRSSKYPRKSTDVQHYNDGSALEILFGDQKLFG